MKTIQKLEAQRDELLEALYQIKGGIFTGASTLVVDGDWQGFTNRLQKIARDAYDKATK